MGLGKIQHYQLFNIVMYIGVRYLLVKIAMMVLKVTFFCNWRNKSLELNPSQTTISQADVGKQ